MFQPPKPNKNRISAESDKKLCEFLLSPYRDLNIRKYKKLFDVSFPEPQKDVSNRLYRLRDDFRKDYDKFQALCQSYGVKSSARLVKEIPTTSPKRSSKSFQQQKKMTFDFNEGMRVAREQPNFEVPALNKDGMLWFRNDDVEIGESFNSILTVYQPLFDARDHDQVEFYLDKDDPSILRHVSPNIPTFMEKDYVAIHNLEEESKANPEIMLSVKKTHKKHAFKMHGKKEIELKTTEYELPFSLSLKSFDSVAHTDFKIKKHYRTVLVEVDAKRGIYHTCAFIFWRILIEGESTNFGEMKLEEEEDHYGDALERARDPPGAAPPYLGDVFDCDDPPTGEKFAAIKNEEGAFPAPVESLPMFAASNPTLGLPSPQHVSSNINAIVPSSSSVLLNRTWDFLTGTNQEQEEDSSHESNVTAKRKRLKFDDSKPMDE